MTKPDYTNDKEFTTALAKPDHKKFCVLPFTHMATTTQGNCRLCCKVSRHDLITDENGVPYNVATHSVEEIWNSKYMRDIRLKLLNDEQIPECRTCWKEEDIFADEWSERPDELPSKRRKENQKWLVRETTKLADDWEDLILKPRIRYFDVRLSNLCNLKCRMCWPQFSTQIAKEQKDFAAQDLPTHYKEYDPAQWNAQQLWQGIMDNSLELEEITFVGGEPTLHSEMYELLELLVEKNLSGNIRLKITTNITNIHQKFLDLMPHFKFTEFNTSIDGVGAVNDYIRHPSKWSTIEANLDKLLALYTARPDNVSVNVTPVIQFYNVFDVGNIVRWYTEKWISIGGGHGFNIVLDLLYDPNHLSANLLSRDGKDQWYKQVFEPTHEWLYSIICDVDNMDANIQNSWRQLAKLMKRFVNLATYLEVVRWDKEQAKLVYMVYSSGEAENKPRLVEELISYTMQLDKHRREQFDRIVPNWIDLL